MQFLSVRASGTVYIDKLYYLLDIEKDIENRAHSDFWAWQTDRFHGLDFYSVTTASGACAIKPVTN